VLDELIYGNKDTIIVKSEHTILGESKPRVVSIRVRSIYPDREQPIKKETRGTASVLQKFNVQIMTGSSWRGGALEGFEVVACMGGLRIWREDGSQHEDEGESN